MNKTSPYYRQVGLLVRTLPCVANETCFRLKSGTWTIDNYRRQGV